MAGKPQNIVSLIELSCRDLHEQMEHAITRLLHYFLHFLNRHQANQLY